MSAETEGTVQSDHWPYGGRTGRTLPPTEREPRDALTPVCFPHVRGRSYSRKAGAVGGGKDLQRDRQLSVRKLRVRDRQVKVRQVRQTGESQTGKSQRQTG